MLQPPRATADEARRLFLSAEQEHRDRPLQRDLYLQAAKSFLAAASSEYASDRAVIDALVFLSNTSLRRSEHVNAIIDSSRVDKGDKETARTKGSSPITTHPSLDQSDRSNYSFKAAMSGRVSSSLLASHSSNLMNETDKSTSSSTLRVSGLRNIPKALPGARVDAVNDLFFLEKKLNEMGMLSTTTSSFKVDSAGTTTSHSSHNPPHGGTTVGITHLLAIYHKAFPCDLTLHILLPLFLSRYYSNHIISSHSYYPLGTAYLASALGESFMLLSAGGKAPPRGKSNHTAPKNEGGIHSSPPSNNIVGGNVSAAYGGIRASKPPSSSVAAAVTPTHLNGSNNNNSSNHHNDNALVKGGLAGMSPANTTTTYPPTGTNHPTTLTL